jgi:hypothetical protein
MFLISAQELAYGLSSSVSTSEADQVIKFLILFCLADAHPSAAVIGTDLSPIQPTLLVTSKIISSKSSLICRLTH